MGVRLRGGAPPAGRGLKVGPGPPYERYERPNESHRSGFRVEEPPGHGPDFVEEADCRACLIIVITVGARLRRITMRSVSGLVAGRKRPAYSSEVPEAILPGCSGRWSLSTALDCCRCRRRPSILAPCPRSTLPCPLPCFSPLPAWSPSSGRRRAARWTTWKPRVNGSSSMTMTFLLAAIETMTPALRVEFHRRSLRDVMSLMAVSN